MIPTRIHGIFDYVIGAAMIAVPWLFGFANSGPETWVPVLLGATVIIYSLFTNYELGLVGLISSRAHLRIDMIAGLALAASPWVLGFSEVVWSVHLFVGILIILTAMMTHRVPAETTAQPQMNTYAGRR
jgi:hypothetical protein